MTRRFLSNTEQNRSHHVYDRSSKRQSKSKDKKTTFRPKLSAPDYVLCRLQTFQCTKISLETRLSALQTDEPHLQMRGDSVDNFEDNTRDSIDNCLFYVNLFTWVCIAVYNITSKSTVVRALVCKQLDSILLQCFVKPLELWFISFAYVLD